MRQGGIFNGMSALGEIDEEMEQIAEQWSRGALTPTLRVPDSIEDWDSDADRAAIIAADQAKLDAEKKTGAVTPSGSGGWAGLTDLQKLGIAVAGVLVVGAVWKAMKPSRSYASNTAKRKSSAEKSKIAQKARRTRTARRIRSLITRSRRRSTQGR